MSTINRSGSGVWACRAGAVRRRLRPMTSSVSSCRTSSVD